MSYGMSTTIQARVIGDNVYTLVEDPLYLLILGNVLL